MKHPLCSHELKLTTVLFCSALFLCGCSSSYTVSSAGKPNAEYTYQEMNEELNGRHVTIELKDGREISAEEVTASNDSVSWIGKSTAEKSKVATRQIERIFFKNHLVGGLEGLGIVAPSVFIGFWGSGGFSPKGIGGSDGWEFPAAVGLIGGGIGGITGAIIGHSYNYEFSPISQSDSLQHRR
jgi:hypothetical protein